MNPTTALYESKNPVTPARKFCAFLVRDVPEVMDGKRTGNTLKEHLPVAFYAPTGDEAINKAIQFWNDGTTKEQAKKERGKLLGKSNAVRL